MENKVTLSDLVRKNIPVILKGSKHPLTEKELLEELAKRYLNLLRMVNIEMEFFEVY